MNTDENLSIEEAKNRLKEAKDKIVKRHQTSSKKEPSLLVSGQLDEVELKRRQKGKSDDE